MYDNNFSISVSLDGPQEEHDRNRVTVNGSPTFEKVIKNIYLADKILKEYNKNNIDKDDNANALLVLTTFDNLTDIEKVEDFFSKNKILDDKIIRISKVKDINTAYYTKQNSNRYVVDKLKKLQNTYLDSVDKDFKPIQFLNRLFKSITRDAEFDIAYQEEALKENKTLLHMI
jgi:uncharacterized protein